MYSTREENLVARLAKVLADMEPMEWEPIISQAKRRVREESGTPESAKQPTPWHNRAMAPGAALALALSKGHIKFPNAAPPFMGAPGNKP